MITKHNWNEDFMKYITIANQIFGREIHNRKWPLTGKGHTVDSVYQSCNTVISDITS